jgi:hypothetical protein
MVLSTVVSDNIYHLVLAKVLVSSGVVVSGGDVVSADKSENKAVMVFEQRTVKGKMDEPFLFSEGDLAGTYILEISVDGKAYKKISYEAYYVPTP